MSEKEIYVAMGLDSDYDGGYSEYARKAFESKQDCEEFLEHEMHGGRIVALTLEQSDSDE